MSNFNCETCKSDCEALFTVKEFEGSSSPEVSMCQKCFSTELKKAAKAEREKRGITMKKPAPVLFSSSRRVSPQPAPERCANPCGRCTKAGFCHKSGIDLGSPGDTGC